MNTPDFLLPNEVPPVFDNEDPDWTLPNGEIVSGWVSGDNTSRKYIYIWFFTDDVPGLEQGSVEYRTFSYDRPAGDWQPLSIGDRVAQPTRDDPEPFDDQGAQLGARFKLPIGRYGFEFRISYQGKTIELRGGNFRVHRNENECIDHTYEQIRLHKAQSGNA
jgi:hypothetical protein